MSTYEFDAEIQSLAKQLRDKIIDLQKDYHDLKNYQNEADIDSARGKLINFVKKLNEDLMYLIEQINKDFEKNKKAMRKIERRMDQIEIDKLNNGSDSESTGEEQKDNEWEERI